MNKLQLTLVVLSISSIGLLPSCGGEEVADTGPKYNFEHADSLPTGYLKELGIVKTNIEVTARLYQKMVDKGYSFSEGALISAGKSFSGSAKQAMGVGAIGSDIIYCATFGQNQSAISRMEGLLKTAGSLGVSEAFDKSIMEKMASEDTTINKSVLLTKAYLKAKDQLFSDERAQLATLMVVGGWVEGLHICSQMMKEDIKDKEVRLGYWELVNTFDNIDPMCKVFKSNADISGVESQIHELTPLMNKIKKNEKKYKPADVAALADAVSSMRGSMY